MTAIVSEGGSSHHFAASFAASFANGIVKVFDRRLEEDDAVVRTYTDHAAWVQTPERSAPAIWRAIPICKVKKSALNLIRHY